MSRPRENIFTRSPNPRRRSFRKACRTIQSLTCEVDLFQRKLLACKDLGAQTATERANELAALRVVFFKAHHALKLGGYGPDVEFGSVCESSFCQTIPIAMDRISLERGEFTDPEMNAPDACCPGLDCVAQSNIQNRLDRSSRLQANHRS